MLPEVVPPVALCVLYAGGRCGFLSALFLSQSILVKVAPACFAERVPCSACFWWEVLLEDCRRDLDRVVFVLAKPEEILLSCFARVGVYLIPWR